MEGFSLTPLISEAVSEFLPLSFCFVLASFVAVKIVGGMKC